MSFDPCPPINGNLGCNSLRFWPRWTIGGAWVLFVVALIGCGGPETTRVPLVRISGTVTLDGERLKKAVVVFESDDGSFSASETDSRGRYDLRFDSRTRGVTLGKKTVRISMNRRVHGLNSNDEGGPEDKAGGSFKKQPKERVPEEYNHRSTLVVDVTADTGRFNFDLHSKKQPDDGIATP
jgi:hypothetical protein